MLTISDNVAADAVLDRVGIGTCNTTACALGLTGTVIASDLRTMIDSIGRAAGFRDWAALTGWLDQPQPLQQVAAVDVAVRRCAALDPARATRTTARDMSTLLRAIWPGHAGPPQACARVRQLMGQQLTRHRLAAGFPPPATVAAKSGGLAGIVRNEVGVIGYPDGSWFTAAVFTHAPAPTTDAAVNTAIGQAALPPSPP